MAVSVDIALALSDNIGPQAGISRVSLQALSNEFSDIHSSFMEARSAQLIPFGNVDLQLVDEIVKIFEEHDGRIIFMGENGVISAYQSHIDNLDIDFIATPSPESIPTLENLERSILVVFDGPLWVRELAAVLCTNVAQTLICIGDGTFAQDDEPWSLPNTTTMTFYDRYYKSGIRHGNKQLWIARTVKGPLA